MNGRVLTRKASLVIAVVLIMIASVVVVIWQMPRLNDQIVADE